MKQISKLADAIKVSFVLMIALGALIQGACSIDVAVSSGGGGGSGSVSMKIGAADGASVNGAITAGGGSITPAMALTGSIPLFEETHAVRDSSGKSASVYVKVVNAPNGITYSSKVSPGEGSVSTQPLVSAEQWLNVPWADSIVSNAKASYGDLSADVGLEENRGNWNVNLETYYGLAQASANTASAKQTAYAGSAYTSKIYGHANDGNGAYSVDTTLNGISGINARFKSLDASSSAGATTEVKQNERITQSFTSTAAYKPKVGTATTKTRTSNLGTEFDLSMKAAKGSTPAGTVGYYVNPGMATTSLGAIQRGINAAQWGDTVNAAAGTYREHPIVEKSLTIKGVGAGSTIVDGNRADAVFTFGKTYPNIDATLSGMTVQNGNSVLGGGIRNYGSLKLNDVKLTGNRATYGAGIANFGMVTQNGGSIDNNVATEDGGGIANFDGKVNLNGVSVKSNTANNAGGIYNAPSGVVTLEDSSVSYNTAKAGGGGIYNWGVVQSQTAAIDYNTANSGGGIYSDGDSVLNLNDGSVSHNLAHYFGGGIYTWGVFTQNGGSISYNTAENAGGGIYNDARDDHGLMGTMTLNNALVDHNTAIFGGAIYDDNFATTNLKNSVISSNSAGIGGGIFNDRDSILTQDGGSISYNTAKSGGGIYSDDAKVIINSGSIDHNKATVYNGGGIFMDNYGTLTVNGGSISNNIAAWYGGGIMNIGTLNLNGGSIDHNQAGILGGGIEKAAGSLIGNQALVHDNTLTTTGKVNNISP